MREFSKYERSIISSSLMSGTGLSGALSDDFRLRSKFIATYKINSTQEFEFVSDILGKDKAYTELVDLINLLQYLLKEGLIVAYPIAATIARNYSQRDEVITLGDGDGFIPSKWLPDHQDQYIGDFIKKHENSHFKATEPLVSLAKHNWQTWDERKHNESIRVARFSTWAAIFIALLTGIGAALGTWYLYSKSYDDLNGRLHKQTVELLMTIESHRASQKGYELEFRKLNERIDSLSSIIAKNAKRK